MAEDKKKVAATGGQEKDPYIESLKRKGKWDVISKRAKGGHPGAIKAMAERNNAVALKQDDKKSKK